MTWQVCTCVSIELSRVTHIGYIIESPGSIKNRISLWHRLLSNVLHRYCSGSFNKTWRQHQSNQHISRISNLRLMLWYTLTTKASEHSSWPLYLTYIWPFRLHVTFITILTHPMKFLASLMFSLAFFCRKYHSVHSFFSPSIHTLSQRLSSSSSTPPLRSPTLCTSPLSDLSLHLCLLCLPISTCSSSELIALAFPFRIQRRGDNQTHFRCTGRHPNYILLFHLLLFNLR